jgi:hypothetical protein
MLEELTSDERVEVKVFITSGSDDSIENGSRLTGVGGFSITRSRADLKHELNLCRSFMEQIGSTSMGLVACGPPSLLSDCGKWATMNSCAASVSVDFHRETFEL